MNLIKKIQVEIIRGTIVNGVGDVRPGTVIDVDPWVAKDLFIAGKAVPAREKIKKPVTRKPRATRAKAKK